MHTRVFIRYEKNAEQTNLSHEIKKNKAFVAAKDCGRLYIIYCSCILNLRVLTEERRNFTKRETSDNSVRRVAIGKPEIK